MDLKEFIKKIRVEKGYSLETLGSKLGFSKGYLHKVETGLRPVSDKLFKSLIKFFPLYKDKITELYAKDRLSEDIVSNIFYRDGTNIKIKEYKLKVYDFISGNDGRINLNEYEKMEFPFNAERKKIVVDNSCVFKVVGDNMKPYFFENDIIYFLKEEFSGWEKFNRKLLLVKIEEDYFIRKIFFVKGKAFLFSFNEDVHPEKEITDNVKFVGILKGQLNRNVEKIIF